jgi:hypothetical protein
MASDILERLSAAEVPPLPASFQQNVHRRLNARLLAAHLTEILVFALPYAMFEFARALAGLVYHTVSGRYETPRRPETE